MNKILTITIPSYNVEKYLDKCLSSFIADEIIDDIEILIVNDGSTDNTGEIALKYQERYPQSFKVISKENGGHGSTINKGLEVAQGKYFKVVDGDDWVDTKDFVLLVKNLKKCNCDLVVTNYQEFWETNKNYNQIICNDTFLYDTKYNFDDIHTLKPIQMHALQIKTSLLQKNNVLIDEGKFYVDVEYILYPIPFVCSIIFYDFSVYVYRLGNITQSMSIEGLYKHRFDHEFIIFSLINWYLNLKDPISETKKNYILIRINNMICYHYAMYYMFGDINVETYNEIRQFDNKLKQYSLFHFSVGNSRIIKLARTNSFLIWKTVTRFFRILKIIIKKFEFREKNGK